MRREFSTTKTGRHNALVASYNQALDDVYDRVIDLRAKTLPLVKEAHTTRETYRMGYQKACADIMRLVKRKIKNT